VSVCEHRRDVMITMTSLRHLQIVCRQATSPAATQEVVIAILWTIN